MKAEPFLFHTSRSVAGQLNRLLESCGIAIQEMSLILLGSLAAIAA